ncbi:MAG: DUF3445 domain-containing protein [Ilumatobacter sp.]|uniref:heme-dependent oxidative N-demethylase family protein n=1 Tax=Ilumatobacter sp. TaxID=1967498 RepID=UPI0026360A91|nr:DUF3445 domain-containing protein [Ilumatobacter sp.]MDJ0768178.1 DUF3445 domain-containing protein [Ilumatobacter sp.]
MDAPRYEPYRDVAAEPFRWRLGLRPLDLRDWLEVDEHRAADLARKRAVMAEHPHTAFRVLPDVETESAEVLAAVVEHLAEHHPDVDLAREREAVRSLHPLDAAGRLVQEDLVIMVERGGRLICGGGSVCFPNRWDLPSKVGRSMAEIHAPVPGLNDALGEPVDQVLARLAPGRAYWRLGWGILDTDELYQPLDGTAPARPAAAAPIDHHLRVERETLRRFPGCVLFTIRTHLTPLATRSVDIAALSAALDAMPDDVAQYKELDRVGPAIAAWLREP